MRIEINIKGLGVTEVETTEVKGTGCDVIHQALAAALGGRSTNDKKPEYFETTNDVSEYN